VLKRKSTGVTFAVGILCVAMAMAQNNPAEDSWPAQVDSGGSRITIYQPQAESWKKNRLEARAAVTVLRSGTGMPLYGIVNISARTEVDKESRLVTLADLKIDSVSFPAAQASQSDLLRDLRASLGEWPQIISLDRLLADLSITDAEREVDSAPLKNDPPKIIFSAVPAVLIIIDGQPVYRSVAGTAYTRVINTPALLLFDSAAGRFYLDGGGSWMTASSLNGPWGPAAALPAGLDQARAEVLASEQKDPHNHPPVQDSRPAGTIPVVYVSTTPAQLIQTRGNPQFAPIARTQLLYVTNTEDNIFVEVKLQQYFALLAGRWYAAKSLQGPWTFVPGSQLPSDFARIPPDGPKAAVLASVPGTPQAQEAVVASQVPQTATVNRSATSLNVQYDGAPQFQPIVGTSMEYATNTPDDVIQADGRYYAVQNAVWFTAGSPLGPWVVADYVPPVIYTMPPSCPLFHDRFVYVYGATPEFVYVGYTPGYLGAYVDDGVVVFGTGWAYPAWIGDSYFGWPWTWGFDWDFGYWGGGWFTRPLGYDWWYHNPWYMHRIFNDHWNPHWHPNDYEAFRNNVNVYNRWPSNAIARRNMVGGPARANTFERGGFRGEPRSENRGEARSLAAPREDLYAGRDGHVYSYRNNGWFQRNSGGWNRVAPERGLEMQRQSRGFGASRSNEFRGFGGFSGMASGRGFGGFPRTTMPSFARAGGFGRR